MSSQTSDELVPLTVGHVLMAMIGAQASMMAALTYLREMPMYQSGQLANIRDQLLTLAKALEKNPGSLRL